MGKPKSFGKHARKQSAMSEEKRRELPFKEDGQEYCNVIKMLGNGRLEGLCADGVTRLCHIRGKMRKRVWIAAGDLVLVGLRDFQKAKCDVIHLYTRPEAVLLRRYGEISDFDATEADEGGVLFEDADDMDVADI